MTVLLDSEIHGDTTGRVPVVLLHSLALDRRVWRAVVPALAGSNPVVTLDLRGHGASPRSSGFTVDDMADDVASTLTSLGLDRIALVGLSLGGSVAQAFASRHPDRVGSLVLLDTTAWYGPTAGQDWESRADKARSAGLPSLSRFQLTRWFSDGFRLANQPICDELLECFVANDLDSYVATCRALGAMDLRDRLHAISAPTLVVVGSEDPATPPSHAEALCGRIPKSELRVLDGARHLTPIERAGEVADLLREFFGVHVH